MKKQLLLLVLICLFVSCSTDDITISPNNYFSKDTSVYSVTYSHNAVLFEPTDMTSIIEYDTAAGTIVFNSTSTKASKLAPGNVVILHGLALRKVIDIENSGGRITVWTEPAKLNEAITDGDISWSKTCDFNSAITPVAFLGGKEVPFAPTPSGDFELKIKYGAYDYTISFKMQGDSTIVSMEIEKEVGSKVTAKFSAEGTLIKFKSEMDLKYKDSTVKNLKVSNENLKGDLTVALTAAASGGDKLNFDFPIVLLRYPFLVGPIPVVLNVTVKFVANAVVPLDGSARVSANFEFDSQTGVKYNGTDVSAEANIGPFKISKNTAETGASNAISASFGLAFPRIELGIFGNVIVPYAQTAFLVGGDFTFMPACQRAQAEFIGAIGYEFEFLGFSKSDEYNLWDEKKFLLKSGDCD